MPRNSFYQYRNTSPREENVCTLHDIIPCSYHKHHVISGGYVKKYLVKGLALKMC